MAVTVPPPPPLVTVSATVVVRVVVPEVPVMVTVAVPSVAVLDAVKVAVTELPVVAVDGLNATVTPLGNPLAAEAHRAGEAGAIDRDRRCWRSRRAPPRAVPAMPTREVARPPSSR